MNKLVVIMFKIIIEKKLATIAIVQFIARIRKGSAINKIPKTNAGTKYKPTIFPPIILSKKTPPTKTEVITENIMIEEVLQ